MTRIYHTAIKGSHRFAGRRIRPTALGLTVFTAALGVSSFFNKSLLAGVVFGQIVAVLCVAAAAFFVLGFIFNKAVCARLGYLFTFFVLFTNTMFVWIELGSDWWIKMLSFAPKTTSLWMGLGVAIIAAGAYWLEGFKEPDLDER